MEMLIKMSIHHCPHCGLQIRGFEVFSFGNVSIIEIGRIYFKSEEISLPPTQYILVDALIRARGRSLSRSMLANLVGSHVSDTTVTKYIERLREAFRKLHPDFNQIECLKGFGAYRWVCAPPTIN
jgi:DNA-binding response OmpR family regulator